jgi:hypothetical protein
VSVRFGDHLGSALGLGVDAEADKDRVGDLDERVVDAVLRNELDTVLLSSDVDPCVFYFLLGAVG